MKISYAILTHNEGEYISKLLNLLYENKTNQDEIVILDDFSTEDTTVKILEEFKSKAKLDKNLIFKQRVFDGDDTQKNAVNTFCSGEYILQIDADELFLPEFIKMLPEMLEQNKEADLFLVPRINTVTGLTQEYIDKWKWQVNEKGWVNFPDYQTRLFRNREDIKWEGLLHSRIVGYKTSVMLPTAELFCMLHPKEIERQTEQNDHYDRIEANGRTKYKV